VFVDLPWGAPGAFAATNWHSSIYRGGAGRFRSDELAFVDPRIEAHRALKAPYLSGQP